MENFIFLYGIVGEEITLKSVRSMVESIEAERISISLNTPGGSVDEGFAIYDYLRSLGKPVTVIAEGAVCSIGTVIFLAGDERIMRPNARLMIHNPWTYGEGDADSFKRIAAELEEVEFQILEFYQSKTGIKAEQLADLMDKETYLNADKAVSMRFATEVRERDIINNKIINMSTLKERINNLLGRNDGIKNMAVELEDGSQVYVFTEDGDLAGKSVVLADENGNPTETPAPDGQHVLADGRTILVVEGVITEIEDKKTGDTMDEKFAALEAENQSLRNELNELKDKYKESEDNVLNLVEAVEKMAKKIETTYTPPKREAQLKDTSKKEEKKRLSGIAALKELKKRKQSVN